MGANESHGVEHAGWYMGCGLPASWLMLIAGAALIVAHNSVDGGEEVSHGDTI